VNVTPIAHTLMDWNAVKRVLGGTVFGDTAESELHVTDADHLGELSGRACYHSEGRPNPATADPADYLKNIIDSGHFSVLEHASVTFYVTGVSRSLLTELERHRFLSFSVESQRYVDQAKSHPEPVIPPAIRGTDEEKWLRKNYADALYEYTNTFLNLREQGVPVKQAREAARAYLPNCTPTDFVVTGNLRCWRDVLTKRLHPSADAEIREFAAEILSHLKVIAPLSFQDF
jgi:thymidylate synthase (FAD)